MPDPRLVELTPFIQGKNEIISYKFDWIRFGAPANPVAILTIESTGVDVSATNLTGVPVVNGTQITMPAAHDLVDGIRYRLTCLADVNGNTLESFLYIVGRR